MSIELLMPALSPTMEEGTLAKWLKQEGDAIQAGDVIAEIETDKATMEFEAVDEGTLGKILVQAGASGVKVNTPIAILLEDGESADQVVVPPASSVSPSTPALDAGSSAVAPAVAQDVPMKSVSADKTDRVFASPLARRLAKEGGLDLAQISGSGPRGRIVQRDVERVLQSGGVSQVQPMVSGQAPVSSPSPQVVGAMPDAEIFAQYPDFDQANIKPHDGMRKTIAKRLLQSKTTVPHFYLSNESVLDPLLALRADINASAPKDAEGKPDFKVSVNDFIIKALGIALQRVPDANVTWTEQGMLQHITSDVGVAVAIEGGLFTPVVRRVEQKSLVQISREVKDLAGRARKRRLKPEEYMGGTTAVSNLGMYGVDQFSAIINPPHATILAVGAGVKKPVVVDNAIEIRTTMVATLSCDHRAVDGALGAELLSEFKRLMENPLLMLAA